MTIYYDGLVLAGTKFRPPYTGQNALPAWADALVYFAPLESAGQVNCSVGALALVGLHADVGVSTEVNAGVGALAMVGLFATVIYPTAVFTTTGRLLLRGLRLEGSGGGISGGGGLSPGQGISSSGLTKHPGVSK